ncbi:MAG: 4Fe-4S dicluster domain-containing protein [Candidatus Helarchaeota archaeon]
MTNVGTASPLNKNREMNWDFYDEILQTADIGSFIDCMTCGKCVGDCIAAENSDFNFRRIIQKILEGDKEGVIKSDIIWKCFLCGLCTIKCPKNIEIKKLILIVRKMALEAGKGCNYLKYLFDLPKSFLSKGVIIGKLNMNLREKLGLSRDYKLSDKAKNELNFILDETGQKFENKKFMDECNREFIKSIVKGNEE